MRSVFILLLISVFYACQSSSSEQKEGQPPGRVDSFFSGFPDAQFLSIKLGEDKSSAEYYLGDAGYTSGEKDNHFISEQWETEVFISDGDVLTSLKVFFLSQQDISNAEVFRSKLAAHASSVDETDGFSVYEYDVKAIEFSATLFSQKDMLRITYELKTAH